MKVIKLEQNSCFQILNDYIKSQEA